MSSKRKHKHEEHLNHEAWAIPYADLITLLLAFFVVMYAISTVNEGKYRVLSNSLVAAFRGTPRALEPIQIGKQNPSTTRDPTSSGDKHSMLEQSMLSGAARSMVRPIEIDTHVPNSPTLNGYSAGAAHNAAGSAQSMHAAAQARLLRQVAEKVVHALDQLVKAKLVVVRRSATLVQVEIRTDILFPSGSAKLSEAATPVIARLGKILEPFPNPILVEGDTDNRPIHTVVFPSNWELSAARAASVVRRFMSAGVAPSRMAVIGHAQYEPIASNTTAAGRNANRRVDIVILSSDGSVPRSLRAAASDDAPHLTAAGMGTPGPSTVGTGNAGTSAAQTSAAGTSKAAMSAAQTSVAGKGKAGMSAAKTSAAGAGTAGMGKAGTVSAP